MNRELLQEIDDYLNEKLDRCARIAKRKYRVWPSAYASGAAVKCRKGKIWKDLEEGKVSSTLSSIAKGDQELRNEFAALIKSRGGWSQQLVDEFVAEKGTDKEDVFGDKKSGRQEQFANLFSSLTDDDYNDFSEEDWSNFWLVAQHADSNRPLQKKAQEILLNYKGEESGYYRYITDRISCAERGSQKYGTQAGCRVEGVKEEIEEEIELVDEDKFKKTTGTPFTLANLGIDLEKMAEETLPNGAPRYYINMFGIEKVGINPAPLSKTATGKGAVGYTSTPIGVYAYPLNKTYYDLLVTGELPYRSTSPHVNILEATDPSNMLYLVDEDSYLTYCEIKMRVIGYSKTLMDKGLPQDECFYYVKDVFGLEGFPYSEDRPGKNKVVQFAKQLLADGVTSVYDPGRGLIHLGERTQIVFLSPKAYKLVHRINNKEVVGSRKKEIINYIEKNVGGGNVFEKLLQMLLNKEMKKFSDAVAPFLKVKQPDKSSKKDIEAYVRAVFDFFGKFGAYVEKKKRMIPKEKREEMGYDDDLLNFLNNITFVLKYPVGALPSGEVNFTNPMIRDFMLAYPTDEVRNALLKSTGFIALKQDEAAKIFNNLEDPNSIDFALTDFFNPLKIMKSYGSKKIDYSEFLTSIKNKIFEESPIGIKILFLRKLFIAPKEIQQQAGITSAEIKKYYINSGNEAAASIGKSYLEKMPFFKRLGIFEEIDGFLEESKKRKYNPDFSREEDEGLHGWFARNKGKGWVNCRTGGPCGRESADKGGKYPACRPTMAQCKSAGKGPLRRKKSSKQISWTGDKKE
jgi:hypothetical protein